MNIPDTLPPIEIKCCDESHYTASAMIVSDPESGAIESVSWVYGRPLADADGRTPEVVREMRWVGPDSVVDSRTDDGRLERAGHIDHETATLKCRVCKRQVDARTDALDDVLTRSARGGIHSLTLDQLHRVLMS